MIVVGTGPEEESLTRLARELGLRDHAHFVGGVNRKELPSYYTSADVMLSLYDYSNLANPVIEAMVLECPVIALDTGGTADLVKDGVNGRLVPVAEEGSVASIAASLLEDPQAARSLGASAASWAGRTSGRGTRDSMPRSTRSRSSWTRETGDQALHKTRSSPLSTSLRASE